MIDPSLTQGSLLNPNINTTRALRQQTLKKSIQATGTALQSGEPITITLRPAPIDTGIIFRRVDLLPVVSIHACLKTVNQPYSKNTLSQGYSQVTATRHLMSALAGLGVDNAYIDVMSPELPMMDGSSDPFVFLIRSAGIKVQDAPKRFLHIKRSIRVSKDDRWAALEVFNGFQITCEANYDHLLLQKNKQKVSIECSTITYIKEISRARNFSFITDYNRHSRAVRSTQENLSDDVIIVDIANTLNEQGLRYPDEFVRHKILDIIGDLSLLGAAIIGAFKGYRTNHSLNHCLLHSLLSQPDAWEYVEFSDSAPKITRVSQPHLYPEEASMVG